MPKGRIRWTSNTLTPRMAAWEISTQVLLEERLEALAQEAEEHMKVHAAWEDQTGEARDGLGAVLEDTRSGLALVLYHSVDYGIWLEVRWSGRYSIILPTIEWVQQQLGTALNGVFNMPISLRGKR